MRFKIVHKILDDEKEFTDDDPPKWLVHKENLWWYTGYVKKLKVGEHIDSDFSRITRIK